MTSSLLHILAMFFMLLDHTWAMLLPSQEWLTCLGRIAFPIFAFMTVEGYFHTRDFKKYMLRMLVFALISEIPFNLMYSGLIFYPYHQNVIWTFMLSLLLIHWIETVKKKGNKGLTIGVSLLACVLGFAGGFLAMLDYYGTGVLTVLVFYFFRERKWYNIVLTILCMWQIHVNMLGGYYYNVEIFGMKFELMQQTFAMLSLIPIYLYNGKKGIRSKAFQYFCYSFYPAHMLLLYVIYRISLGF